jgi:cytochrome c biogenesis protein CcmG/thiol:disulfide interchange protein DsbE
VILAVSVLAFAATDFTTRYFRSSMRPDSLEPFGSIAQPYPLPSFHAVDLDGNEVSPERWRGRIVLVNFWATWCGPCRVEMPEIAAMQEKYRDALLVVGVLTDPAAVETAKALAASAGAKYPIVPLNNEIDQSFSEAPVLPMTYLVDPAGRLVAAHAGRIDAGLVEREIQMLVERRAFQRGPGGSQKLAGLGITVQN